MNYQDKDATARKGWFLYRNTKEQKCICSSGKAPDGYSLVSSYVVHSDCETGLVIYCADQLNKNVRNNRGNTMIGMMMGMKRRVLEGAKKMMGMGSGSTWHLVKGMDGKCQCIDTHPDSSKIVLGSFPGKAKCKEHIATDC